ncbi:MAG: endopeptidase La [Eubacteriales bacterium]|nr:endopeptidase La [Eubacteriales bacterium]
MTTEDKKIENSDRVKAKAKEKTFQRRSTDKSDHLVWDKTGNLPLLPLRGVVIYPNVLLSFDVGRERSILALQKAMENDNELILSGQKNVEDLHPEPEDIYDVGTRALVRQILELPDGSYKVLVYGLERVKIDDYTQVKSFYEVDYTALPDEDAENTPSLTAASRVMGSHFQTYASLTEHVAPDAVTLILNESDVGKAADLVAGQLRINISEQQELLQTSSVVERVRLIIDLLQREIQLAELEQKITAEVQFKLDKNQKDYYLREQVRAIQEELGEEADSSSEVDALRQKLDESGIPEEHKPKLHKELDRLSRMPSHFPEYATQRTWLETLLDLPFGRMDKEKHDINAARKILERDHFGMEKVKERILEHLAVRKLQLEKESDHKQRGPILCFVGPPGTGKTSIARAIAEAVGRRYIRVSLGGIRDEAEIRGHRRTYIGSMPGRIIQGIRQVESDNPLFLLDEVDKLGDDFRGDPSSALLEVLDPEQNNSFRDHYVEIPYDLSNVLFITTANTTDTIPGPLLDRMEVIELSGYTEAEKIEIAVRHLIPRARKRHGLTGKELSIRRPAIAKIIQGYTAEAGVRQLEREISHLCRRAALAIAEKGESSLTVTAARVPELLGNPRFTYDIAEKTDQVGVATGLAWTWAGGDTLTVEVNVMPGKGDLILTGKLGDVMKESAQAALTYILSRAEDLKIDPAKTREQDIHIHVPAGAIPKDGPSAGITLATALASALTGRAVRHEIAMTGEVTLRGRVLPIGGLKEKSVAAARAQIKHVLLPKENERDLSEIPESVKEKLKFSLVDHMDDVLSLALLPPEEPEQNTLE